MLRDVPVYPGDIFDPEESPSDPRLVRHDSDRDRGLVELSDSPGRSLNELDPFNRSDVTPVDDDRAVAVEKNPGPRTRVDRPGYRPAPAQYRRAQRNLTGSRPAGSLPAAGAASAVSVESIALTSPDSPHTGHRASCAYECRRGGCDTCQRLREHVASAARRSQPKADNCGTEPVALCSLG
jgi:hypothetical protein